MLQLLTNNYFKLYNASQKYLSLYSSRMYFIFKSTLLFGIQSMKIELFLMLIVFKLLIKCISKFLCFVFKIFTNIRKIIVSKLENLLIFVLLFKFSKFCIQCMRITIHFQCLLSLHSILDLDLNTNKIRKNIFMISLKSEYSLKVEINVLALTQISNKVKNKIV